MAHHRLTRSRQEKPRQERLFFSEEKKQKTFVCLVYSTTSEDPTVITQNGDPDVNEIIPFSRKNVRFWRVDLILGLWSQVQFADNTAFLAHIMQANDGAAGGNRFGGVCPAQGGLNFRGETRG